MTCSSTSSPRRRPWRRGWPPAPRRWWSTTTTSRRPSCLRRGTTSWPWANCSAQAELAPSGAADGPGRGRLGTTTGSISWRPASRDRVVVPPSAALGATSSPRRNGRRRDGAGRGALAQRGARGAEQGHTGDGHRPDGDPGPPGSRGHPADRRQAGHRILRRRPAPLRGRDGSGGRRHLCRPCQRCHGGGGVRAGRRAGGDLRGTRGSVSPSPRPWPSGSRSVAYAGCPPRGPGRRRRPGRCRRPLRLGGHHRRRCWPTRPRARALAAAGRKQLAALDLAGPAIGWSTWCARR